ncbi:MAG TPA: WecB/TagA/CpsF family glycosyltransferase [Thermoleophilaceae bacterium]|nr:WecB/TagA/CpsF family glycosyltransferase [Thermoleophilaceae bacterium]
MPGTTSDIDAPPLLGLPCAVIDVEGAREFAVRAVEGGEFNSVLFANAAKVVMAESDAELRAALFDATLLAADGQSLVWASRILGQPLPERVAGIDYMLDLLQVADSRGWRVFFLGGRDEVLEAVEDYCRRRHPGLIVAGRHNGYFGPERDAEVAAIVRKSDADVMFVGMPSPRKELWIDRQGPATGVSLAVASGGSFDVIAGVVRRAPALWQRLGLEWFWRVVQEPRRLWKRYLTTNSRFLAKVARERLRGR